MVEDQDQPSGHVPLAAGVADCEEAIGRLYSFLDGELTEDRRRAIASHLDGCGPCVEAFDFEAELRKVVADRCRDRVPDLLRDRIAEAIRSERTASDVAGPERS